MSEIVKLNTPLRYMQTHGEIWDSRNNSIDNAEIYELVRRANLHDKLVEALEWAMEYMADASNPTECPPPNHHCEYKTNPERGKCDFCYDWVKCQEALELANGGEHA